MPVFDSEAIERQRLGTIKDAHVERRSNQIASHIKSNEDTVADDAGRDTTSLEAQMGKPLSCEEMKRRLSLCNGKLVFERSIRYPELTGIYLQTYEKTLTGTWQPKLVHICGMESGIMPEFTVRHTKRIRVPDNDLFSNPKPTRDVQWKYVETYAGETRGWRKVLMMLLEARLITEADVTKHFGWVPSKDTENWA